jgi:hypothetical protein
MAETSASAAKSDDQLRRHRPLSTYGWFYDCGRTQGLWPWLDVGCLEQIDALVARHEVHSAPPVASPDKAKADVRTAPVHFHCIRLSSLSRYVWSYLVDFSSLDQPATALLKVQRHRLPRANMAPAEKVDHALLEGEIAHLESHAANRSYG